MFSRRLFGERKKETREEPRLRQLCRCQTIRRISSLALSRSLSLSLSLSLSVGYEIDFNFVEIVFRLKNAIVRSRERR